MCERSQNGSPARRRRIRRPPTADPSFTRSSDTLYRLSKEREGTAGPLATTRAGGRLEVPMLGVVDEAANVCWHDFPELCSHYGSR